LYRIEILAITGGFFKGSSPSGSVPARLYTLSRPIIWFNLV
jgi:hypothetical protein